jgi:hypothetical protein
MRGSLTATPINREQGNSAFRIPLEISALQSILPGISFHLRSKALEPISLGRISPKQDNLTFFQRTNNVHTLRGI